MVDGGVANNFPITIMKSKGMDIIIGVDVEGRLFDKDKLTSAIAILNQIVSYQMYQNSEKEKEQLDVYIHPDIFDYTIVDFDKKIEVEYCPNNENIDMCPPINFSEIKFTPDIKISLFFIL